MEKQDAIDFIVEAFEQGKTPSEIARDLSREMKAPYDVVAGFVNRTLDQRIAFLGSVPPPPPLAGADSNAGSPEAHDPALAEPGVDWNAPTPGWTAPVLGADWTSADLGDPVEPDEAPDLRSFMLDAGQDETDGVMDPGYSWEIPVATEAAQELPKPAPVPAPVPSAAAAAGAPDAPAAASSLKTREIDPKLEKFILDALGSDKKHSDIVMAVCERTGMDWSEAQRVVGRVGAMNRKKVASRRNRILIPLSIVAMLAGLAVFVAGLQEFAAYKDVLQGLIDEGAQGAVNAGLPQDAYRPDYLIGYLLLGLGLFVGGGVGLFQSLKAQLE